MERAGSVETLLFIVVSGGKEDVLWGMGRNDSAEAGGARNEVFRGTDREMML